MQETVEHNVAAKVPQSSRAPVGQLAPLLLAAALVVATGLLSILITGPLR
jgi:hypothetical protein